MTFLLCCTKSLSAVCTDETKFCEWSRTKIGPSRESVHYPSYPHLRIHVQFAAKEIWCNFTVTNSFPHNQNFLFQANNFGPNWHYVYASITLSANIIVISWTKLYQFRSNGTNLEPNGDIGPISYGGTIVVAHWRSNKKFLKVYHVGYQTRSFDTTSKSKLFIILLLSVLTSNNTFLFF